MISQWLSNPQSRVELWLVKGFCLLTCMSYYLHVLLVVSKVYVDLVFWWWVFDLEQTNIRSEKNKDKTSRTHVMGGSPSSHREFPSISRSKSVHPVTYSKHRGNVYSKLWQQHVMRFKDWEAMPYPRWAIACYRYQLQLELGEMPLRWNWLQFPTRILLISWSFLWVIPLYHGYTVDLCRWTMRSWWKALFHLL